MANDKSFQDPTNLENKLQRHQEFVAEVNANEQRIQKIAKVRMFINIKYVEHEDQPAHEDYITIVKCIK